MTHTYHLSLASFALPIGDAGTIVLHLQDAAQLRVEFDYDPGYADVATLPNGDPGEPGMPETFEFKRITTSHAHALASANGDYLLLVSPNADLKDVLHEELLAEIAQAMRVQIDIDRAQERLDRHLAMQEDGQ